MKKIAIVTSFLLVMGTSVVLTDAYAGESTSIEYRKKDKKKKCNKKAGKSCCQKGKECADSPKTEDKDAQK